MLPTNRILTPRFPEANGHEGRRMGNGFPQFLSPTSATATTSSFPNSGTADRETLFRGADGGPKRSFGEVRSQTEFGNETDVQCRLSIVNERTANEHP